jgi:hypothetical protein
VSTDLREQTKRLKQKEGIQKRNVFDWIPVFTGMTGEWKVLAVAGNRGYLVRDDEGLESGLEIHMELPSFWTGSPPARG